MRRFVSHERIDSSSMHVAASVLCLIDQFRWYGARSRLGMLHDKIVGDASGEWGKLMTTSIDFGAVLLLCVTCLHALQHTTWAIRSYVFRHGTGHCSVCFGRVLLLRDGSVISASKRTRGCTSTSDSFTSDRTSRTAYIAREMKELYSWTTR